MLKVDEKPFDKNASGHTVLYVAGNLDAPSV